MFHRLAIYSIDYMIKEKLNNKIEDLYSLVVNEEDARICTDIPEDACKYTPANFFLIILSNTFTKLGDALSNPKTVLTWLMHYINAPLYLIGFLVPVRESGSMLPQIIIASYIRKMPSRKWVWVLGSVLQSVSILGIAAVAFSIDGAKAGWLILLLLILFSLSRGLCSIASKDIIGKTIPKTRRGRLNGYSTSVSGVLVLLAGIFMILKSTDDAGIEYYGYLLLFSGLLWMVAAAVYSNIKEYSGQVSGGGNALNEAVKRLSLIKKDKPFRIFIIARSLLLCSALTAPFYVVLAQTYIGNDVYILGMFIIASGVAASVSAPIWGKMADVSSKHVMVRAALITSLLGILMYTVVTWIYFLRDTIWIYPFAFFVLGIAHSGARLGRKTYIIDMAGGNKRTDYVAVSNTIIGLILLITGGISALASMISPESIVLVLSLFGLFGAYVSHTLPDVED